MKIDVEGAEYNYNIIQPQLRAIILEFHPLTKKDWEGMAYNIMNKIGKLYKYHQLTITKIREPLPFKTIVIRELIST